MNYVFYDFETSGTNRYFDQPIQIAAAYVNDEFEAIQNESIYSLLRKFFLKDLNE